MAEHIHRGLMPPKNIRFEDKKVEAIFPCNVWSAFPLEIDNDAIIDDCYAVRDDNLLENVQRSNVGGWQSEVRVLTDIVFRNDACHIFDVGCRVVEFANECSRDMESDSCYDIENAHLWVNINSTNNYNVLHSHPKTDLVAVYYPIHEEGMGELCLVRHDASLFLDTYRGVLDSTAYDVEIESGLLVIFPAHLLHYVMPNTTGRDRISISFNLVAVG